ncbi:hypothetical protein [Stakelama tenebrarum]|uniref:DUF2569 domain-containing protein n=1 Tax=Stakelama tenebrarum TaxID=2711215 RepID=A0A6G6Y2L4_9SPHN|nr:hypothetical protein [Sphingosinithalassobacter tenebrarum]QIG79165.1 hypothetical protein G5C33_04755 [Sphingosinithalassobacter tenebrarum]
MRDQTVPFLPKYRRYGLILLYGLTAVLLGSDVWPAILGADAQTDPIRGIALSIWGTFSLLAVLGIRYPERMLPLLFAQFTYKVIWLCAFALPRWRAGTLDPSTDGLFHSMAIGLGFDLVLVPWIFVARSYFARFFVFGSDHARGAEPG